MRITRIISSNIEANLRVLKHTPFKNLVKNNELLSDFGHDANPYPGIKGAYESATTSGRGAVLGFFNKYAVALHGENRHYSTLPDGSEQVTEIYQLNEGSILIRAGIVGGTEKYSLLINPDGTVDETTPLKTLTGDLKVIGDMILNGLLTVNGNKIILNSPDVEIGDGAAPAFEKLMTKVAMDFINLHSHKYQLPAIGAGLVETATPTQQMAADTHTTKDTTAS